MSETQRFNAYLHLGASARTRDGNPRVFRIRSSPPRRVWVHLLWRVARPIVWSSRCYLQAPTPRKWSGPRWWLRGDAGGGLRAAV